MVLGGRTQRPETSGISTGHQHVCAPTQNQEPILQGSHGDWKTGKTGKMIMVREKSGKSQGTSKNDQKSGNFVKSQGIFADVSKITDTQIMGYKSLNMCSP